MYRILHIPTGEFVYEYYGRTTTEKYDNFFFGLGKYKVPFSNTFTPCLINESKKYAEQMLCLMGSDRSTVFSNMRFSQKKYEVIIDIESFNKNQYDIIYIEDKPC